jgi:DtxR family transcriptional regulator, Mn-dependent transcriptional regulator
MEIELSQEAEEYVEMIYKLQKRDGMARTKELAEIMHVVPGSITNTIGHLKSHELVTHEPYRGVRLTREGEKIALEIIRKHRLAECLLIDVLKAEWSTVHEEACKLEHALSKDLTNLLDRRLGHPKFCPHGNPIPTENGLIDEQTGVSLNFADLGERYIIDRIIDEEHANLQLLAQKKIKPEVMVQVVKHDTQNVSLLIEGEEQQLSWHLVASVLVRKDGVGRNSRALKT